MSIEGYIKGERYGKKARRLERKAMSDPFLQDAIDDTTLKTTVRFITWKNSGNKLKNEREENLSIFNCGA